MASTRFDVGSDGLPNFTKYGFHTNIVLLVTCSNGEQFKCLYQGYGLFTPIGQTEFLENVVSWQVDN